MLGMQFVNHFSALDDSSLQARIVDVGPYAVSRDRARAVLNKV